MATGDSTVRSCDLVQLVLHEAFGQGCFIGGLQ